MIEVEDVKDRMGNRMTKYLTIWILDKIIYSQVFIYQIDLLGHSRYTAKPWPYVFSYILPTSAGYQESATSPVAIALELGLSKLRNFWDCMKAKHQKRPTVVRGSEDSQGSFFTRQQEAQTPHRERDESLAASNIMCVNRGITLLKSLAGDITTCVNQLLSLSTCRKQKIWRSVAIPNTAVF